MRDDQWVDERWEERMRRASDFMRTLDFDDREPIKEGIDNPSQFMV